MSATKFTTRSTPLQKRKTSKQTASTIGVYLRVRPLERGQPTILKIDDRQVQTLPLDGSRPQAYKFSKVFDDASQAEVFNEVGKPLVEQYLDGKDGLVFSYGITGSGKTYTMEGVRGNSGLIFRSIKFIFNSIGQQQTEPGVVVPDGHNSYTITETREPIYPNLESAANGTLGTKSGTRYCVFLSLIELYNKKVIDLLDEFNHRADNKKCEIRTDKRKVSYVANATEIEVKSAEEAEKYYRLGVTHRRTGTTALNQESSRGHCVLNLKLVRVERSIHGSSLSPSQLCLVDLAGSERAKRSGATGETLHEACSINNSLGALRKCIRALRDGEPTNTIQYREHNLTRLFRSYFEGHGTVSIVLCVKPSRENYYENNIAMEFGLVAQDVITDFASPPKRTRCADDQDPVCLMDLGPSLEDVLANMDENLDPFEKLRIISERRERQAIIRRKYIERVNWMMAEFRKTLVSASDELSELRREKEKLAKEMKLKDKKIEALSAVQSHLDDIRYQMNGLDAGNKIPPTQHQRPKQSYSSPKKLHPDMMPSAPVIDLHQPSSSPETRELSATETSGSNEIGTTTTTVSTEHIQQQRSSRPRTRAFLGSPTKSGLALAADINHSRSHSCSCMRWIDHKPTGTIETSTQIKPKIRNRRSVKVLRTSDILRKDAAGYSIIHQSAEPNGDVTSSLYTGKIVSTVTGGAQVILDDVEVLRRESPIKRRRAASDAH